MQSGPFPHLESLQPESRLDPDARLLAELPQIPVPVRAALKPGSGVGQVILNRIFNRDHIFALGVELIQEGIELCLLTTAGRSNHKQHSVLTSHHGLEYRPIIFIKAQLCQIQPQVPGLQQT